MLAETSAVFNTEPFIQFFLIEMVLEMHVNEGNNWDALQKHNIRPFSLNT